MSSQGKESAPPPDYVESTIKNRFDLLMERRELDCKTANDLRQYIPSCKVVLLADDSTSMSNVIAEEGNNPFAPRNSTRWMELQKLAAILIEFVTALTPQGLDLYFLNRKGVFNATSVADCGPSFQTPPDGKTPLCAALSNIFRTVTVQPGQTLLILVLTDGCPSDGTLSDFLNLLLQMPKNVHVSMVELTDDESDMEWLDQLDGVVSNFDNTDDYREEVARVMQKQGPQFKFNRNDYVAKILLATFSRWYFNLDQNNNNVNVNNYSSYNNPNTNICTNTLNFPSNMGLFSTNSYSNTTIPNSSMTTYINSMYSTTAAKPSCSNSSYNNESCLVQ